MISGNAQTVESLLALLNASSVTQDTVATVNNDPIIKQCIVRYIFPDPDATQFIQYLNDKIYKKRGVFGLSNETHSLDVKKLLLLLLEAKKNQHNNDSLFETKLVEYCFDIGKTDMRIYLQKHFKYYTENMTRNATGVRIYRFFNDLTLARFLHLLVLFSKDFKTTCEDLIHHVALENLPAHTLHQYLKAIAFSTMKSDIKRAWVHEALCHCTSFPHERFYNVPHSPKATIEDIILLFLLPLLEGDTTAIDIGWRKLNIEKNIKIEFILDESSTAIEPNNIDINDLLRKKNIIALRKAIEIQNPQDIHSLETGFFLWFNIFTLLDTLVHSDDLLALFATSDKFQSSKEALIGKIQVAFNEPSLSPEQALTLLGNIAPYYALSKSDGDYWDIVYKKLYPIQDTARSTKLMQDFFNIVARWIEPSCKALLTLETSYFRTEFMHSNVIIFERNFNDWDDSSLLNYRPYKLSLGIITRLDQLKRNADQKEEYKRYHQYYQSILEKIYSRRSSVSNPMFDHTILSHLQKHNLQPFTPETQIEWVNASADTMNKNLSLEAREWYFHPDYPRELRDMMIAGNSYNLEGLKEFLALIQKISSSGQQPTCFQELFIADLFNYFVSQCFSQDKTTYLILFNLMLPETSFLRCSVSDKIKLHSQSHVTAFNAQYAENIEYALNNINKWTNEYYFNDDSEPKKVEIKKGFIRIIQACIEKMKASLPETNELLDYLFNTKMIFSELNARRAQFLIHLLQNILSLNVNEPQTFHDLRTCIDDYKKGSKGGGTHLIIYTEKLLFTIAEKTAKEPLTIFWNMYLTIKSEHLNPARQDFFVNQLKTIVDNMTFINAPLRDYIKFRVNPTHIEYWVNMMNVVSSDLQHDITYKDYLRYLQQYNNGNDNRQSFVAEEVIALLQTEMSASYFNAQPDDFISTNTHAHTICAFLINKIKEERQTEEILQILLADRFNFFIGLKAMGAINSVFIDNDLFVKKIEKDAFNPVVETTTPLITDDTKRFQEIFDQLDSQKDQQYDEISYTLLFNTRDYLTIEIAALSSQTVSSQHLLRVLNHLYCFKNIPEQQARECVAAILDTTLMKELIHQHFVTDNHFVDYLKTKLDAKHLHDVIGFLRTLANETLRNDDRNTFESCLLNHCMKIGKTTMPNKYIPQHLCEQGLNAIYAINIKENKYCYSKDSRLTALQNLYISGNKHEELFPQIHDVCLNNYEGTVIVTEKLMDFLRLRFLSNTLPPIISNAYITYLQQPDPIFSKYSRFETELFPSFIDLINIHADPNLSSWLSTIISDVTENTFILPDEMFIQQFRKIFDKLHSKYNINSRLSLKKSSSIEFNDTLAQQLWDYQRNFLMQRHLIQSIENQQAGDINYWKQEVTILDNSQKITVTRLDYILKLFDRIPHDCYAFLDYLQESIYSIIKEYFNDSRITFIVTNLLSLTKLVDYFLENKTFKNDFSEYYQQCDTIIKTTRCETELIPNLLNRLRKIKTENPSIEDSTLKIKVQQITCILDSTNIKEFDPITLQWLREESIDISQYNVRQCPAIQPDKVEVLKELITLSPEKSHPLYNKLIAENLPPNPSLQSLRISSNPYTVTTQLKQENTAASKTGTEVKVEEKTPSSWYETKGG